jgi:type IV pilus assembly protein PilY1
VAAYAGDLYGNLWKFDLSSSTPSDWRVAFGGKPLFNAINSKGEPEPISAAPEVMRHPLGGLMVLAGSGKLFENNDPDDQSERTLYGVWDKVSVGASSARADDRVTNNDLLVTQTITALTIKGVSGNYFAISNNGVDYGAGDDAKKRGWKIRMSIAKGQRLIYEPKLHSGRVIFDTLVPGGTGTGCAATVPSGYIFVLDPFTGAPGSDGPTFDTNGDGYFTAADNANAAVSSNTSSGGDAIVGLPGLGASSQARFEGAKTSELVQLGKRSIGRQWRQIATPPAY